jgi:hypothetical protein
MHRPPSDQGQRDVPLQNRVTPFGEIIAHPARGLLMGNRGILHDGERRLGRARWRHPHWVTCLLVFRGRWREVMRPKHYTELFFLDEATALAAGHRPCAQCRHADFVAFRDAWRRSRADGGRRAGDIDRALHLARIESRSRRQVVYRDRLAALPDGVVVMLGGVPGEACLVLGRRLLPWRPDGYGPARWRPRDAEVTVLTPRPSVAVLAAGYRPLLHPSACG